MHLNSYCFDERIDSLIHHLIQSQFQTCADIWILYYTAKNLIWQVQKGNLQISVIFKTILIW